MYFKMCNSVGTTRFLSLAMHLHLLIVEWYFETFFVTQAHDTTQRQGKISTKCIRESHRKCKKCNRRVVELEKQLVDESRVLVLILRAVPLHKNFS